MGASISEEARTLADLLKPMLPKGQKQLKRLPHVFCKFLDLPFAAETPILVQERRDCYAFIVQQPGLQETDMVAEVVQIVPGATKVVLRGADRIRATLMQNPSSNFEERTGRSPNPNPSTDPDLTTGRIPNPNPPDLPRGRNLNPGSAMRNPNANPEMRQWRLRLPACTVPEAASTTYAEGTLTITIPKVVSAGFPSGDAGHRPRSGAAEMNRPLLCAG